MIIGVVEFFIVRQFFFETKLNISLHSCRMIKIRINRISYFTSFHSKNLTIQLQA